MTRLVTERLQLGMPLDVPFPAIAVPRSGHDDRTASSARSRLGQPMSIALSSVARP